MAKADFDRDGDVDLIITNYKARAQYYVNQVARGHWLQVRLRGRKNNRDGIGAIIRVRCGENLHLRVIPAGDGYASQFSRVAHFGIGENEQIDELEVSWPNGAKQVFKGIPADRIVEIDEDRSEVLPVKIKKETLQSPCRALAPQGTVH